MRAEINRKAWDGLEELRPYLTAFLARRCRDASEVDDVVQEALLRAASYRADHARPHRLRPWLVTVALRVLSDRVRRRRCRERAESDYGTRARALYRERQQVPGRDREPAWRLGSYLLERGEALEEMRASLCDLEGADRLVLGKYVHGSGTCRGTAEALGLRGDLVKVRLFRARRRLRMALRRRLSRAVSPSRREVAA